MSNEYTLKIRKSDLPLITFLNDGVTPKITKTERYLVFKIDEDGSAISSKILTKRELLSTRTIVESSPLVLRLRKES